MEIGLGCVNLGSASSGGSWSDHVQLVHAAIDGGITVLDTADAYGAGSSERIIGRAVRGRRDAVTIATKGGYLFRERWRVEQRLRRSVGALVSGIGGRVNRSATRGSTANRSAPTSIGRAGYAGQDFTPTYLRSALDASLRRLGTDHVDVYQLHGPADGLDDVVAELNDLRRAGKVRRFGVGTESIQAGRYWAGVEGVDVVQLPFGLLDPGAASSVFPVAADRQVDIWVRGVLGGGVLAAALADRDSVAHHPKIDLIDRLLRVSADAGIGLDELAVRWALAHPSVSVTLLGMSSMAHLRRNLAIASLPPLDLDVREALDAVVVSTEVDDR